MNLTIQESLPTAKNARAAYEAGRSEKVQKETQRVVHAVLNAQREGRKAATLYPPIAHAVIEEQLRQLGYDVQTRQTGPNEHSTEVGW